MLDAVGQTPIGQKERGVGVRGEQRCGRWKDGEQAGVKGRIKGGINGCELRVNSWQRNEKKIKFIQSVLDIDMYVYLIWAVFMFGCLYHKNGLC